MQKLPKLQNNEVELDNGTIFMADNVVVATGPFTGEDFDHEDADFVSMEQEFYEFKDKEGMPDMFQEDSKFGSMLGWLDNEGLLQYKISRHGDINRKQVENWIKHRLPSFYMNKLQDKIIFKWNKADEIINKSTAFQAKWCFRKGKQFVYETKEGVHYSYGFRGNGFFYMPLHGKIVYDSLLKNLPIKYALL